MNSPNLALIGRAGAGKSTAADFLEGDYDYRKMSFAAPLKAMCGTTTDREMLQTVGCGVRELVEDGWVNLFLRDLRSDDSHDDHRSVVVDDCRFPNEYWTLKEEGFVFVEITADEDRRIMRLRANGKLQDVAQLQHTSETALDGYYMDYRIRNTATADDLYDEIVWVLDCEARRA